MQTQQQNAKNASKGKGNACGGGNSSKGKGNACGARTSSFKKDSPLTCFPCSKGENHSDHETVFDERLGQLEALASEIMTSLTDPSQNIDRAKLLEILERIYAEIQSLELSSLDAETRSRIVITDDFYCKKSTLFGQVLKRAEELVELMSRIKHVIHQPYQIRAGEGDVQSQTVEFSLAMHLLKCCEQNWHNGVFDGTVCKCSFHGESLQCHLIMAMLYSFAKIPIDMPTEDKFGILISTLLHDIGKPACAVKSKHKNIDAIGFPSHGEVGSALILEAYSDLMGVDINQWRAICAAVRVHMCGYHETDPDLQTTQTKWKALCFEETLTKIYLHYMSYGDHYGKISEKFGTSEDFLEDEHFEASRGPFLKFILQPFEKYHSDAKLIFLRGPSGSGKSSLAKELLETIPNSVHLSRDLAMSRLFGHDEELSGQAYASVYEEYNANKREMSVKVNTLLRDMIFSALREGKTVIVDSQILLYFNGSNHGIDLIFDGLPLTETGEPMIPILAIDVIRNEPLVQADGDRKGITLEEQIKISKRLSVYSPYPEDNKNIVASRHSLSSPKKYAPWFVIQYVNWNKELSGIINSVLKFCGLDNSASTTSAASYISEETTSVSVPTLDLNMSISHYVNKVWNYVGFDTDRMIDVLVSTLNLRRDFVWRNGRIMNLQYLEGSRNWTRAARDCRGTQFYLHDNVWKIFNMCLERGTEIFGKTLISKGITSTENQKSINDITNFAPSQQAFLTEFKDGNPNTRMVATSKVDGCIVGISLIPKGVRTDIFRKIVDELDEGVCKSFHSRIIRICDELELPFDIVTRTSGTFLVNDKMLSYVMTAILVSCCDFTYEQLLGRGMSTPEMIEFFSQQCHPFVQKLFEFWKRSEILRKSQTSSITMMFEAVCKGRRGAAKDSNIQNELACRYEECVLSCFGVRANAGDEDNQVGRFYPHYQFESMLDGLFIQPAFFKIVGTENLEILIDDVDKVCHGIITYEDFQRLHPASNSTSRVVFFDPEGFVVYRHAVDDLNYTSEVEYFKGKTASFYDGHKPDKSNADFSKWSERAFSFFPKAREYYMLNSPSKDPRIVDMIIKICVLVTLSVNDTGRNDTPKINGRPEDVKFKMSVNNDKFLSSMKEEIWVNIICRDRNSLSPMPEDFLIILKKMLVDVIGRNWGKNEDELKGIVGVQLGEKVIGEKVDWRSFFNKICLI